MADAKDKKDKKDLDPNDLAPGIDPKWGVTVGELNYAPIDIQVKEYANLYETFEPASKAVDDAFMALLKKPIDRPVLIRTTPGIGKTESGIHFATIQSKQGIKVFFAVSTRDMAWQILERFKSGFFGQGHTVIVFDGRHDGYTRTRINDKGNKDEIQIHPNCINYDRVVKAAAKGYPPGAYVCPSCPMWPNFKDANGNKTGIGCACPYYKTLYKAAGIPNKTDSYGWAPIILVTHQMIASIVADSDMVKPDVIIVDEDWRSALRETFVWSRQELDRHIQGATELAAFRKLLLKSIDVAEKYKKQVEFPCGPDAEKDTAETSKAIREGIKASKIFTSYGIHGTHLANIVKAAANELGVDCVSVIEAAANADTGVSRGEYMAMGEYKESIIPHHKELDLAAEFLMILGEAQEGKDKAYRVSLRWDDKSGWEYYWDYVRRSSFGGPSVFLDAYGDEALVSRVCGHENIDVIDVHCKVRSNTEIHCYQYAKTSRTAMEQYKDKHFDSYVDHHLRTASGKKILLYTQKCYVEWLKQKILIGRYGLNSFTIKWFWQDRGDDSYGDYDMVVLFGTPYSNVVAERHFANAMFYGEEPLDWTQGPGFVYIDQRVKIHMDARQYKEMLQAAFRVRPSKTQKIAKKQEIVIVSSMKLDLFYEFPGAKISIHKAPQVDKNEVMKSVWEITKMVGGWTEMFSAFIFKEKQLKDWIDAGGVGSGQGFIMSYEEVIEGMKKWNNHPFYRGSKRMLVEGPGMTFRHVRYRKRQIWMCGEESEVRAFLDQIRRATREPGSDDDMDDDGFDENSKQVKEANALPVNRVGKPRHNPSADYVDGFGEPFDELTNKAFIMASDEFEAKAPDGSTLETFAFVQRVREIYQELRYGTDPYPDPDTDPDSDPDPDQGPDIPPWTDEGQTGP